jgi:putative ABC transport system permease protein
VIIMRIWARIVTTLEGVGIALDAIRSNKVRAALTIMGVAVGVFVVVGMGAAIHGISASFESDVNSMGASTFMVRRRGIGINSCDGSDDTVRRPAQPARHARGVEADQGVAQRAGRRTDVLRRLEREVP